MSPNQVICSLPQDILIQILLLLPSDSIPAWKLTSKEFKNLTYDPRFLNRYKSLSFFHIEDTLYCLSTLGNRRIRRTVNGRCSPAFTVNRVPIKLDDVDSIGECLSESSKGRACVVTTYGQLFFSNSITGITDGPEDTYYDWICFGFGYDRYADDCKTLMAFKNRGDEVSDLFRVYSVSDRVWKQFKGFPYAKYLWDRHRSACSFDGVLHWVVQRRGSINNKVIVTYDLHTRGFGEMFLPDVYKPVVAEWETLFTVWVMREYGMSESWTMFLRIEPTRLSLGPFRYKIEPLMLYKCGNGRRVMLFVCKHYGTLYWYDIDNGNVRRIQKNAWEKKRNRKPKAQQEINHI